MVSNRRTAIFSRPPTKITTIFTLTAVCCGLLLIFTCGAIAREARRDPATENLRRELAGASRGGMLHERRNGTLGFFSSGSGPAAPPPGHRFNRARSEAVARTFLRKYERLFGVTADLDFSTTRVRSAGNGRSVARFRQTHGGVPVFGGEVVVQVDAADMVLAVGGKTAPDLALSVTPGLTSAAAALAALRDVANRYRVSPATLTAADATLWIFAPGLLELNDDPPALAWGLEVADAASRIREMVMVNANNGGILLSYSLRPEAKNRQISDAENAEVVPGTLRRSEGEGASGIADVDSAYVHVGWTYDFYAAEHGRDAINGSGGALLATVRYDDGSPNAFWDGSRMVYSLGYAAALDVVAHEYTHGVTEAESDLIYYGQSGAINESFSDIWGELVELTFDSGPAGERWVMGEAVGSFRDMENPPAYGDPDKRTSANWYTGTGDNAGVHTNSGVGNKAAFLMVDGGNFNGRTVTGLGISKVADLYYEAQTNVLYSSSNYGDLYYALLQAALNLGYSAADRQEIRDALDAVEMTWGLANVWSVGAQPFGVNAGLRMGDVAWGDYDNDGDLDLAAAGEDGTNNRLLVYRNNGGDSFTQFAEPMGAGAGVYLSSIDWGDYDNDGDLDLAVAGNDGVNRRLIIYRNSGGSFANAAEPLGANLGVAAASVQWGDYDNDGDLDLAVSGYGAGVSRLLVLRNNGADSFTTAVEPLGAGTGLYSGASEWGDYDNDGDLDLVACGLDAGLDERLIVYRNDACSFVAAAEPLGGGAGVVSGSVHWGDCDNDGDLDLAVAGFDGASRRLIIFRNDGGGSFTNLAEPLGANSGVENSSVRWGDYDNDGLLDLAAAGFDGANPRLIVYRNTGDSFTNSAEPLGANVGVRYSAIRWCDYEGDGDPDFVVSGADLANRRLIIYKNLAYGLMDSRPVAPVLTLPAPGASLVYGDTINFRWTDATGDVTPGIAMGYNLRLGTTPGGCEIVAADANAGHTLAASYLGNVQNETDAWFRSAARLPIGTYYWSAQAVDGGQMRSLWATERSFTVVSGIPIASAGSDTRIAVTDTVILNGTASADPQGDTIVSYLWTCADSRAHIAEAADSLTTATFDTSGYFIITLFVSTGNDTGSDIIAVDIPSVKPGDLTSAGSSLGVVDSLDLAVLVGQVIAFWGQNPADQRADLVDDNVLDFEDIAEFAKLFGQ